MDLRLTGHWNHVPLRRAVVGTNLAKHLLPATACCQFWSPACCDAAVFLPPRQSVRPCAPSRQPSWAIPTLGRERSRYALGAPSGTLSCGSNRRGALCARA